MEYGIEESGCVVTGVSAFEAGKCSSHTGFIKVMEAHEKMHLTAKQRAASTCASVSNRPCQATLDHAFRCPLSKSTSDGLTNSLTKWIAMDCRPILVAEDRGLAEVLQIASSDVTYKSPSRGTIVSRITQLYDTEKQAKEDIVVGADYVALTVDHWSSASNHNYLGVTAYIIENEWKLQSFTLTIQKKLQVMDITPVL